MGTSRKLVAVPTLALLGLVLAPALHGQVFSLDDNPVLPATTPLPAPFAMPFPPFGYGAEDSFGILMPPPGLAPSPSLALPGPVMIDGTTLTAAGAVNVPPPFFAGPPVLFHNHIDALSNNSIPSMAGATINLLFSIDRKSSGVPGSHSFIEAGFNQQPADIYISSSMFPPPGGLPPALPPGAGYVPARLTPPKPGANRLLYNQDRFGLTAGLPPGPGSAIAPFTPAPPIGFGTHDNIDAFELRKLDTTGDMVADVNYFFSFNPVDAIDKRYATGGAVLFDSADVWVAPAAAAGGSVLYAAPAAIGLAPIVPALPVLPVVGNDIDALVVWDVGNDAIATPGVDFALFSLAPGSLALAATGTSPADIFFTDFSGSYAIYASAADLGLGPLDNIDALEIALSGDANLSGNVNFADLAILAANYGSPVLLDAWTKGDFDGNGVVGLSDLVVLAGGFGHSTGGAGSDLPTGSVPEPLTIAPLVLAAIAAMCRWRTVRFHNRQTRSRLAGWGVAIIFLAYSAPARAANVAVTTSRLPGGGNLYQHLLSVGANDGDVLGFEILVQAPGGINQLNPFGQPSIFADQLTLFPPAGMNPAEDSHLLYNSTDGFSINTVESASQFGVATGVPPAGPLVGFGTSRNLLQLVTQGNFAATATRLRVNVGGGGGDQNFDGFKLNQHVPVGDYNGNNVVDAADYVLWRETLGVVASGLPADGDLDGTVNAGDFTLWRTNFGQVPGSGLATGGNVPEPSVAKMLLLAAAGFSIRRSSSRIVDTRS